jgi:enoyl-[acyl-carrier protein] reductase I
LLQTLYEKDAMAEYGSVVALTYIAAQRTVEGYSDMAEAKAMLESIARSFGAIYARKGGVRVNTVSQSPTLTTAGQGIAGMGDMYNYTNALSPLGNASADECADYVITLFSDLTRKVTMQNLYHDGGFSSMGVSAAVIEAFSGVKG